MLNHHKDTTKIIILIYLFIDAVFTITENLFLPAQSYFGRHISVFTGTEKLSIVFTGTVDLFLPAQKKKNIVPVKKNNNYILSLLLILITLFILR